VNYSKLTLILDFNVYLQMNDWIRDRFMNRKGQVETHWGIFAGACAGACSATVVNPIELVKIRMQAAGQLFPRAKLSVWKLVRNLGFTGIYKVLFLSDRNSFYVDTGK